MSNNEVKKKRIKRNKNIKGIIVVVTLILTLGLMFIVENIRERKRDVELQVLLKKDKELEDEKLKIKDSLPRIICFGDSLTYGVGGNGINYPKVLSELTRLKTKNYGVIAEGAKTIAYRQGAITMSIDEFKIPPSKTAVEITLKYSEGEEKKNILLAQGDSGVNPIIVGGIEGKIELDNESSKYYFTRSIAGDEVSIPDNTQIITRAMSDKSEDDIYIIFSGTNNRPNANNIKNIINIQKRMIEYADTDKYIIVGMTSKDYMSEIVQINEELKKEYGDKFLDIRQYILENGLNDAVLTPTEQDLLDISNGEIPSSLRVDTVHGNSYFYNILGNKLYEKIIQLKYLNEEQKEYLNIKD